MRKEKNEPHFPQQLFLLCFQLETTTSNLYRWKHLQCYWAQNDTSLALDAAFQNHFPLLLQPREHLSTTPEANTLTLKLKNGLGRRFKGGGKVKLGLKRMGQVHFKQLVLPQVVSKLTWPRLHLFSQEIPGKVWFDTEPEPCPTLLPCPQIRKIMDIMSGNREAHLGKCKKYP